MGATALGTISVREYRRRREEAIQTRTEYGQHELKSYQSITDRSPTRDKPSANGIFNPGLRLVCR